MVSRTEVHRQFERDALDVYRMKLALHFLVHQSRSATSTVYGAFGRRAEQLEDTYQAAHQPIVCELVRALGIAQRIWLSWANPVSARQALQTESDVELLGRVHHMRRRTEGDRATAELRRRAAEDEPVEVEADIHGNRYARPRPRRSIPDEDDDERVRPRDYTGVGNLSALEARVQAITGSPMQQALTEVEEEYLRSVADVMTAQGTKDALAPEPDFSKRRLRVKKP